MDKRKPGFKEKHKYKCEQRIYRLPQPNGTTKLLWLIFKPLGENIFNKFGKNQHYLESNLFESEPGISWIIRLEPGIKNNLYDRAK